MRACFLGQNVTALGFGFAMLQTPPLQEHEPNPPEDDPDASLDPPSSAKPPVKTPEAA